MSSAAEKMVKARGVAYGRLYLKRPEDGSKLARCEHGHENCAHYKRGPCIVEMQKLVKAGK